MYVINLHVAINQPVELKIFIVISERIDELFCHLEQTHEEEELKNGINWNVEVDIQWHAATPHVLALFQGINFLTADHREHKKEVSCQGHNLKQLMTL